MNHGPKEARKSDPSVVGYAAEKLEVG